jgi:predicted PolB exonuclease-like 3'-5' exonuclease
MRYLVFDIETILDPAFPPPEPSDEKKSLPAPPFWQVVTIGALLIEDMTMTGEYAGKRCYEMKKLGAITGSSEKMILSNFSEYVQNYQLTLVSFNGRGFDMPVIAARCFHHGVPMSWYYKRRDMRYRYSTAGHLDIMDFLSDYGASKSAKLDVWSKLCGMPGKVGVDGSQVAELMAAGKQVEVDNYCLCDVVQTAAVFLRTLLIQRSLTLEGYRQSVDSLFKMICDDARLEALAKELDFSSI